MDKQIWMGKFLILTFLIPLFIYFKTLLPTVGFWDTGEFQTVAYTLDIAHPTGYPTYILISKFFSLIFPVGEFAWRINFLSALFASLGIFIFSLLIKKLTNNTLLGILSGIFLAVNPYLWSIAVRADPHTLHFLFASLFLYFSYEILNEDKIKLFPILSLITGISLGNHMLSVFFIPTLCLIGVSLINKFGIKKTYHQILLSIVLFVASLSVYLLIPLVSLYKEPLVVSYQLNNFEGFKRHVLGEDFQGVMGGWTRGTFQETLKFYLQILDRSFPYYSWVLSIVGILLTFFKRKVYGLVLIFIFSTTLVFSATYQNASIERYFVTTLLISSLWFFEVVSIAFSNIKNHLLKTDLIIYILLLTLTNLITNYKLIDESKNYYAHEWATDRINSTSLNSVIFSWWSYSTPLWYLQKVEGVRTDVEIINKGMEVWEFEGIQKLDNQRVYFIQKIDLVNSNYYLLPIDNIYELRRF